jgi:PAS domain S-box-containing protein
VTVSLLKKATKTQKTLFEQLEAQNKALVLNQGEECKLSAEGWERKEKEVVSQLVENLSNATEFIRQVGKGCYDVELKGITAKNMHLNLDNLSGSLLHMREQLKQANLVDQRRNWAAEGLANFSEILRGSYANLPELSYHIIAALVKYVKANQAGLFIVNQSNDQEIYLELMACYAYERKKYVTKKIAKGEGLVGQALLEKDTIYLTDVPKEYVQITSGLGGATPTSILIVPLLYNEQVFGVLELASFQAFAAHEIEFIEKLSESIASTLATVKINEQTKQLLEASQQQAEELRSQEEEMRQNMEELEATQEEAKRIYSEMDAQTNIINNIAIVSKTDLKGNITYVNEEFLKWSKYTREEVMGKNHRILKSGHQDDKIFEELWKTISSGKTFRGEIKNKAKDGTFYWVDAIIAPVLDEKGKPKEYIAQRFVIDEAKEKEAQLAQAMRQAQALEKEIKEQLKLKEKTDKV